MSLKKEKKQQFDNFLKLSKTIGEYREREHKDREKIREQSRLVYKLTAQGLGESQAHEVNLLQEGLEKLGEENELLIKEKAQLQDAVDELLEKNFNQKSSIQENIKLNMLKRPISKHLSSMT